MAKREFDLRIEEEAELNEIMQALSASIRRKMLCLLQSSSYSIAELAKLLKGMLCHINLIPVNHVEEREFYKGDTSSIKRFTKKLVSLGMNATVRRELGSDISASCGQLRKKVL